MLLIFRYSIAFFANYMTFYKSFAFYRRKRLNPLLAYIIMHDLESPIQCEDSTILSLKSGMFCKLMGLFFEET